MQFHRSDTSVVPDTLIDFTLKFNICHSRWLARTRIKINNISHCFKSLHWFVKFPLVHIVIATVKCHSAVNLI